MTNGRINVGLFICHLDNDYAYDICKGVDYAVKELDANLYIFPGMYINAAYNDPVKARYDNQYNSVFYYASPKNLDVLIVSIGTIGSFLSESDIKSFIDNFKDIPILVLEIDVPGYSHLYVESKTGLKQAIEHLIHVHNKKKIGLVGGRQFNADAVERLNIYKETLEENGMEVSDDLIVHGNFSEFCEDIVGELLDRNPDMDAIVFANDQMALGGYNELKRRGIEIGKDIAITGFDDASIALALVPNLTTVSAAVPDLGYHAVYEAMNVLKNGKSNKSVLESSLIVRHSCGCQSGEFCTTHQLKSFQYPHKRLTDVVADFEDVLLKDYKNSFIYKQLLEYMRPFYMAILEPTLSAKTVTFPKMEILDVLNNFLFSDFTQYFTFDKFSYMLDGFSTLALKLIEDDQKKINFLRLMHDIIIAVNARNSNMRYLDKRDYQVQIWNASYIARDTLDYGKDNATCFSNIMEKLEDLAFISSYIYLYDEEVMSLADGSWRIPEELILQAYDNDMKAVVLDNQYIASTDIFDNPYTPKNRRCTFILNPIFTNDQQHGIFVCEIDITKFHHIYATDLQLGTAFKFLNLIKEQMSTQNQLMLSLQEIHNKNNQLNQLSVSDELTKLYNRRGFMELIHKLAHAPEHDGQKAIIVYADMDNLKLVNDKFGHSDGDFAIQSIADILRNSFRKDDIIGRIGGDEFIAFAFLDEDGFVEKLQGNLKANTDNLNATCGKPYYIDISVGISEFVCSEDVALEDVMSEADTALYVNKKYKRISVLKD